MTWKNELIRRHEVPVTSDPIEVVHMDEDLVVVNKPASIPVSYFFHLINTQSLSSVCLLVPDSDGRAQFCFQYSFKRPLMNLQST